MLRAAVFLAVALSPASASASEPVARCETPAHHQLDFRLGRFRVTTASGMFAGTSEASAILHGCAVSETWAGAVSGHGQGLSFYDSRARLWQMSYVNEAGDTLHLTGRFEGDALVLRGENYTFDGRSGLHRMTWSPLPDHGVRQLWEFSTDRGRHWQPIFDGRFTHG